MYFIIIVAQKFLVRIFCVGMLFLAAASARASALASAADSAVANADPSGFAGFDLNQTREVLSHEPVDSPADNLQQFFRPGLRPGLRLAAKGRRLCSVPSSQSGCSSRDDCIMDGSYCECTCDGRHPDKDAQEAEPYDWMGLLRGLGILALVCLGGCVLFFVYAGCQKDEEKDEATPEATGAGEIQGKISDPAPALAQDQSLPTGRPAGGSVYALAPIQPANAQPLSTELQPKQVLQITCPSGVEPGMIVQLQTPDGRRVQVAIPEGVVPGQEFQYQV
jgi:hypothetical protein